MTATNAPQSHPRPRLSLPQLASVNDVITEAVVGDRPLEQEIEARAADSRGRVRTILERLGRQLRAGVPLGRAVRDMPDALPAGYADVIEAGIRTDRLGRVLGSYSDDVWRASDLHRQIGRFLIYPILVTVTAYGLFLFVIGEVLDKYVQTYVDIRADPPWLLETLHGIAETSPLWGWLPPVIIAAGVIRWRGQNDTRLLSTREGRNPFLRIPGVASAVADFRVARLANFAADLLDADVPFDAALRLATAAADGDEARQQASGDIDQDIVGPSEERLPPYLFWLLTADPVPDDLAAKLAAAAEIYTARAERSLAWFRLAAPLTLLVLIGGVAAVLFALSFFAPLIELLGDLSTPVSHPGGEHRL
ncbi:MAG: type II secretion system F family protein [Planctomycetota bacterium]